MNVKFFIVKGKRKYSSIHVRFWDSKRIDQKTKTGISVLPNDWSSAKERLKLKASSNNIDEINQKLEHLERRIVDQYNLDYNGGSYISNTWLKDVVNDHFSRSSQAGLDKVYFVEWVRKFTKNAHKRLHNGKPIKKMTIKNYTTALRNLEEFEKYKNYKYKFQEIDLEFHQDFVHFCTSVKKLNLNSTGSIISRIKTFCRNIEIEQLPINPLFKHKNFVIPKQDTKDIYLSDKEIKTIYEFDFSNNERLDNARDLFIIGLRTGLRVSDFLRITEENILDNVINVTTQKTDDNLTIPIHPQFRNTLKKRKGKFPREISDQKFNEYIKEICKEVGFKTKTYGSKKNKKTNRKEDGIYEKWELVTSHTCRRSFATNLYLGGVENTIAMKATGHKSEKQYLNYVKASLEEHVEKLNNYWNGKN